MQKSNLLLAKAKNKLGDIQHIIGSFTPKEKKAMANLSAIGTIASSCMCFAAATGNATADAILGAIVGMICTIFMGIGILLLVWSIGQLVLAFKNEDADSKSRAMMIIIVSICLIAIKPFLTGILSVAGVSLEIS